MNIKNKLNVNDSQIKSIISKIKKKRLIVV